MSNVLVVGGAGYVGGGLVDELIRIGETVRVFDNLTYEDLFLKNINFVFGDILNFSTLEPHLKWADCVIWLAAFVGDHACAVNPDLTLKTNVESVKQLVNSFGGRIVFPSTCSVYGAQDELLDESSKLNPLSLYAESKLEAEEILGNRSNVMILRLGTLFGLSDSFARLRVDLVLNALTIKASVEKVIPVFGGAQFRPLLHVKDVATAIVPNVSSNIQGIYNLHTDNLTILELANLIIDRIEGSKIQITDVSFQDARNYRVSSEKARNSFGFNPKYSIKFGINEIANLVESRRITNFGNPRFTNSDTLRIKYQSERTGGN